MAFGIWPRGVEFFGLKDYSQRQGHLSCAQEAGLCRHFTDTPPRTIDEVRSHIAHGYEKSCSRSGAAKLMRRLGFVYKKPVSLPAQADEAEQKAFIADYEALMTGPGGDEMVVFSGAVHPTHQSRPAHGWFLKDQKTAIKSTSGRKRLNIQGAPDLETFQFTFVEAERINAQTTQQMLQKLKRNNPTMATIHVFLDNARYRHAKLLQPWLNSPDRKIRLHFLPAYAPHLNPIERLWGVMHKWVTHNRHYATFGQFTEAILKFFRKVLPDKWREFEKHGGQGEFVTFENNGHNLMWATTAWKQPVRNYIISPGFAEFDPARKSLVLRRPWENHSLCAESIAATRRASYGHSFG